LPERVCCRTAASLVGLRSAKTLKYRRIMTPVSLGCSGFSGPVF
jgi:hypothetical protein